jgi:hypothetical protein
MVLRSFVFGRGNPPGTVRVYAAAVRLGEGGEPDRPALHYGLTTRLKVPPKALTRRRFPVGAPPPFGCGMSCSWLNRQGGRPYQVTWARPPGIATRRCPRPERPSSQVRPGVSTRRPGGAQAALAEHAAAEPWSPLKV